MKSSNREWMSSEKWVRSDEGWVAGVCEGLGERFGFEPWIIRAAWFVSIFFFGFGLLLYLVLALTLPREDQVVEAMDQKVLGVCSRISDRTGMDVGFVRFVSIMLALSSAGAVVVGYIVLHFVLPEQGERVMKKVRY